MKKISVIVPVYNVEAYLHRCIDSILNQTYENLEIILVNDGSTDNSGAICDSYRKKDKRIKVIHKKNGGLSSARNAGLDTALGDYVAFVDSDDWIAPDIYEHCMDLIKKENCDVVDYECILVKSESFSLSQADADTGTEVIEGKEILRDYLLRGQTHNVPFTVWRKLYKRELFQEIRFPEGKINEDIATNYKVLKGCKRLVHTDKVGYFYFQDSNSITRAGFKARDFDLLDACNELKQLTENEKYPDIQYLVDVKYARSYFSLLAKIAFYGIEDKNLDEKKIVKELTKKLRQNYFLLMGSPIPLNRKLMITVVAVNINLLKIPLSIYKRIK